MASIYRTSQGQAEILQLYDSLLEQLNLIVQQQLIETRFGLTNVLVTGPQEAPPLIIFQGGNTVNPITLSWFLPLTKHYRIYAPDTIGHPGKSSEKRISPKDDSFGKWVVDLLDFLKIQKAPMIGPSYGAGIILRTAAYAHERISKAVLIVPSGIETGSLKRMVFEILIPMLVYRWSPSNERLLRAVRPIFNDEVDEKSLQVIGSVFRNVKLETKMPRLATAEELKDFTAPTLVLAGEKDIFFPASKILPQAKVIIPNLVAGECLQGSGHFLNAKTLNYINQRIFSFLQESE
ncbi:alpha/beta fold hydrolase [Desulfosporosinus nitroreducens]|uniref:Alpha/beta hydrolase n=1 Tax=Desulfosporosinus nitroreducens TaxID=2018668 RepID=A0ABT8QXV3_9FIRM|nr:alpha/beta hydrolase [Desulfosporosinus nitroreducens]MCO1603560.1 alpha/beta hydrolase [Desulfosporosinus nitroreducens]MDO0825465.1 alpha/beta hydrolase [Desulfosporosinus nitroreducens]